MPQTRISERTHRTIRQLAAESGCTFEQVIDDALGVYERDRLLTAINDGYAALRGNAEAWAAEEGERAVWDGTLADGIDSLDGGR